MLKLHLAIGLAALASAVGSFGALAQTGGGGSGGGGSGCGTSVEVSFGTETLTYNGYSNNPAQPKNSKGTSTVLRTTRTESVMNEDCSVGTKTEVNENYVDGPGKSPFENRNPKFSSCEATGTLSCP